MAWRWLVENRAKLQSKRGGGSRNPFSIQARGAETGESDDPRNGSKATCFSRSRTTRPKVHDPAEHDVERGLFFRIRIAPWRRVGQPARWRRSRAGNVGQLSSGRDQRNGRKTAGRLGRLWTGGRVNWALERRAGGRRETGDCKAGDETYLLESRDASCKDAVSLGLDLAIAGVYEAWSTNRRVVTSADGVEAGAENAGITIVVGYEQLRRR